MAFRRNSDAMQTKAFDYEKKIYTNLAIKAPEIFEQKQKEKDKNEKESPTSSADNELKNFEQDQNKNDQNEKESPTSSASNEPENFKQNQNEKDENETPVSVSFKKDIKINFKAYDGQDEIFIEAYYVKVKTPGQIVRIFTRSFNFKNNSQGSEVLERPVLFLHGYGCSGLFWYKLQKELLTRINTGVFYFIDLPGSGLSTGVDFNKYKGEKNIEIMNELIENWCEKVIGKDTHGQIKKFDLVGHSMGGYVSGRFTMYSQLIPSFLLPA